MSNEKYGYQLEIGSRFWLLPLKDAHLLQMEVYEYIPHWPVDPHAPVIKTPYRDDDF